MRVLDLFAGCGGFSLGMQEAGHDVVAAYDVWIQALQVYNYNMDHRTFKVDLSTPPMEHIKQWENIDVVIGGPPCQGFSSANIAHSEADKEIRSFLTIKFCDIAVTIGPRVIIMENVPKSRMSDEYVKAIHILENADYFVANRVINCNNYGVPQKRKRLFTIACTSMSYLSMVLSEIDNQWQESITVYDYLGDELGVDYYWYGGFSNSGQNVFSVHEAAPTIVGKNWSFFNKYWGNKNNAIPPHLAPKLTEAQLGRLQTFPKWWEWPEDLTLTDQRQMIGNAVPVEIGKVMGHALK